MQRTSGILLHPSALPGRFRLGDFGKEAFLFVDFLVNSGQSVWQMLPLGPTGYGHSPYNTLSAFAGNPILIDPEQLVEHGDLERRSLDQALSDVRSGDFSQTHLLKNNLLIPAGQYFLSQSATARHNAFELFCQEQSHWLDDFSLFMALRDLFHGKPWSDWPPPLRLREPQALEECRSKLADAILLCKYQQFVFIEQWSALKDYANQHGVRIFGDIPIFVAYDSADVWANQHLFQLDNHGKPTAVAGVPPDYFSESGQRWGNPLYRWDWLETEEFCWWLKRFEHQLDQSDLVRIDHFRGFQACWSIPVEDKTAINGHWEEVPGRKLFEKLTDHRKDLPIIAEDLGIITTAVEQLRDDFGFPGMKILQFAFDSGPDNPYLPENHTSNSVVYTGTHDNNTTLGWWQSRTQQEKDQVYQHLDSNNCDMPWPIIELAIASIADLCILPCQDILGLGKEARFNTPGQATGNWQWQLQEGSLNDKLAEKLLDLTTKYRRLA